MSSISVAQASARGTFVLLLGNLVSTGLGTLTVIFVARLLGPEGYGKYTLAFLVPGTIQLLVGFGVASAVTRFVAYSLSTGDVERAKRMTFTAMIFTLAFGLALSALDLLVAPYLLTDLIHRSGLIEYQALTSLLVLGTAMVQCATYAFVGYGSMGQVGGLNILQSAVKLVLQMGLIAAGFGVFGALTGHVGSYLIAGCGGFLLIYMKKLRGTRLSLRHFVDDLHAMLDFGLPIFSGNVAQGVAAQYLTFILAAFAANAVVGYYQAAVNVTIPISMIAIPLANVLFRSFAELQGLEHDVSIAFGYAVKYVSLISTPISFFLLAAAGPLFGLFYGHAYDPGIPLLQLISVAFLPVAVGLTVMPAFFSGVGKSRMVMFILVVYAATLAGTAAVFVVGLGLQAMGAMLAILVANVAEAAAGLAISFRYLNMRLSPGPLLGIVLAGAAACALVMVLPVSGLSSPIALGLDLAVFAVAYVTLVPLTRGLDNDDVVRLSITVETMGPLRGLMRAILRYEQAILRATRRPAK